MVIAGFFGRVFGKQKWLDRTSVYAVDLGLVLVALSAAPFPWVAYAALLGIATLWLLIEKASRQWWQQRRDAVRICLVVAWLLAMFWESPYQFTPSVTAGNRPIHVIGDSITAGLGDKIVPWPVLVAKQRNLEVHSHASAGATTSQALSQAEQLPDDAGIVIVEIGGNDMLGSTSVEEFERDLDALLNAVGAKSQQVVMFELPLPPLYNDYGRVQRSLAAKHGVRLAPKRLLMGVLASSAGTSDTIHLTQSGHEQLAALVSEMIK